MWAHTIPSMRDGGALPEWQQKYMDFMFDVNDTSGEGFSCPMMISYKGDCQFAIALIIAIQGSMDRLTKFLIYVLSALFLIKVKHFTS